MGNSVRKLQRQDNSESSAVRKIRAIPYSEPSPRDLMFLSGQAGLSIQELRELFDAFLGAHPDGRMTQKDFCEYYSMLVYQPAEQTEKLSARVFKVLSITQTISLNEFFMVLALMSKSDINSKLEYVYYLYDTKHTGAIEHAEAHQIVNGIFELLMADNEEYSDQNIQRLAKHCWHQLKTTRFITREHFIEGLANDKHVRKLLS